MTDGLNVYGVPVEVTANVVKIGEFGVNPPDDGDPEFLYVDFPGMYITIHNDKASGKVEVTMTKFDRSDEYVIAAMDSTGKTWSNPALRRKFRRR